MPSSRMGTVHCSCHLGEGVCQGLSARGCLPGWGGGGFWPGSLPGGVYPPVDRMTDARENITFPELLLRMVKIQDLQTLPTLCNYGRTRMSGSMSMDTGGGFKVQRYLVSYPGRVLATDRILSN